MKVVEDVKNGWRKAILVDDWGSEGYYLRAVKSDMGTWGHSDQDKSQLLRPGDRVEVLWPDGSQTTETLAAQKATNTVYDMGHDYDVDFEQVGIWKSVNGKKIWISDFSDLRFKRS